MERVLQSKLITWGKNKSYLFIGIVWALWHIPIIVLTNQYHHEGNKFIIVILFTLTVIAISFIIREVQLGEVFGLLPSFIPSIIPHGIWEGKWYRTPSKLDFIAGESGWIPLLLYGMIAIGAMKNRNTIDRWMEGSNETDS